MMALKDKILEKLQNASLPGSVCINLGEEKIAVDTAGSILSVPEEADCTLSISQEVLENIVSGEIDPMNAYFAGDLSIEGDMGVAMALANVLK